jgi:hypothetical protein
LRRGLGGQSPRWSRQTPPGRVAAYGRGAGWIDAALRESGG